MPWKEYSRVLGRDQVEAKSKCFIFVYKGILCQIALSHRQLKKKDFLKFGKKNIRILGKAKNNREHPIVLWKTLDLDSENLDPRPGFLLETRRLNQISLFFSYHCTGALGMSIANPSYHLKWICE